MEESKDNVQRPFKGMVTDCSPVDQPKETYRYALNAANKTDSGDTNFPSMEKAVSQCTTFPTGTRLIASIYMVDEVSAVFLVGNDRSYIGTVDKASNFKLYVATQQLNLSEKYPISGTFRIRRNSSRVIYWVDGHNKPRIFNFDRLSDFYSSGYETFLQTHTVNDVYNLEKWSDIKFDLIKTYTEIPLFEKVEILNSGSIPSGSYSAAIQLVDENLSPTQWITTSNPIPIYVDSLDLPYAQIRGSRNVNSPSQNFQYASKSIKWTFGNLDSNFSYYRIAVLVSNSGNGSVNKALVSQLIPIDNTSFTYAGNDSDFTTTPVSDIEKDKTDISSAKFIEQLENRVILGGIKGKQIDWCSFQRYASTIKSNLVTKNVTLDDITAVGAPKNPQSSFTLTGYMWGEVYSFGIVYIFKDGFKSPVYHIPGKPNKDIVNGMDFYECAGSTYLPIHSCSGDYWGINGYNGSHLLGTTIKHHKFPKKNTDLFRQTTVGNITQTTSKLFKVSFHFNPVTTTTTTGGVTTTTTTGGVTTTVTTAGYSEGIEYTCVVAVKNNTTGEIIDTVTIIIPSTYVNDTEIEIGTYLASDNVAIADVTFNDEVPSPYVATGHLSDIANSVGVLHTSTDICGIKFRNIQRPHPDVIGFEIVRNERTEDDKIVVDNAIVGALTCNSTNADNPYHSFGLLLPNLANTKKSTQGVYIFSPEHQFRNKKISFDKFEVIGTYTRNAVPFVPLKVEFDAESGNLTGSGMYINDVRPGTTFNSAYNKGEDPDGFDLQVLYRSNEFTYAANNTITLPNPDKVIYLSAAGSLPVDGKIFFNASIDNKIIIASLTGITNSLFTTTGGPRLLYVSLIKNNMSAYSGFINRTYYKETNNPTFFGGVDNTSSSNIFNGDSYTAPITINSSTYYDTQFGNYEKKSRVWKIVLGAVLTVGALALMVIPGGQVAGAALLGVSTAIMTAVTVMAISYGVSMLTSGIEFETMKNMIDQHYEAGLKETIEDNDNKQSNYILPQWHDGGGWFEGSHWQYIRDDRFEWFVDRLQNIYIESSINMALRSGLTSPTSDFINSPSIQPAYKATNNSATATKDAFEVYLANKFTVIDREQNSGRLYLGYANAEFYDINLDYLRKNYEKHYFYLPVEYDCCSTKIEEFNNRVFYSEQSFQEEKLDNYRNFLPNNYKDIEGQFGEISGMFRFNNTLYIHTTESLLILPQNMQERINQELVTFIGTGEFFSIPPRKVMDGDSGSYGSSDNRATTVTKKGVFFVNNKEGVPYMLGSQPQDISAGNSLWFNTNLRMFLHNSITEILGESYIPVDNVVDQNSVGIHSAYDPTLNRIIVTKIDYKPIQKIYKYVSNWMAQIGKLTYNPTDNLFYYGAVGGYIVVALNNTQFFENKSWTMSYSLDTQSWVSYHSYLPRIYMSTSAGIYSSVNNILYKHNSEDFCVYYGTRYPHIIEYVSVSNPVTVRTWDSITVQSTSRRYLPLSNAYIDINDKFFDKVVFSNSRQCSGEIAVNAKCNNPDQNNYLLNQIKNVQSSCVTEKIEQQWSINDLRDYVIDYTKPMFLVDWNSIKNTYPIDKVVNQSVINPNKNWFELESFRDKYLVIRLIFSNFGDNNVQLVTNYSIENEQQSLR